MITNKAELLRKALVDVVLSHRRRYPANLFLSEIERLERIDKLPKHPFEGRCSNFGCSICGGPQDEPT